MPTVITTAVESLKNTATQNLFTIATTDEGTTRLDTVLSPQTVTFNTTVANIGNAITANVSTGVFSLSGAANVAYQLSASLDMPNNPRGAPPVTYGWVNADTLAAIGPTAVPGVPVSTVFYNTTGNTVTVAVQVASLASAPFVYPTQIQNATATVTELSGYTVA
jgi:hypothetical protein